MSVLLSAMGLSKSFLPKILFADLAIELRDGDRIGLIGPNGAGKSTLLKILAGLEPSDEGVRSVRRGVRIDYLSQDDSFPEEKTVREVILDALADKHLDDYECETTAATVLSQVGFDSFEQRADTLSGGWRKRLSIARVLARAPDFLLMDEPTNHLDLPGVIWLERLLASAPFGYMAASHDRAFLRAIAPDIVEVNRVYPGGVFRATGGYDAFAERRDAFLEAQERQRDSVANRVRVETDWLGHKARARTRKASSRIEAAADRRGELAALNQRTSASKAAGIDFAGTGRQTRKLLNAIDLSKSLGGRLLFEHLDMMLTPGMKLGLLGPNGSGKSTILKIFAGLETSDTGTMTLADDLKREVFEQGRTSLDPMMTLKKALAPNTETVMYRDQPTHVIAWAKRFLFRADQLELELNALSGGEQARVRIAQLMLRPADLLLLDEPTNDLDIPALELLEETLEDYPGAVVLVSHDRELMDRICTDYIGLDGEGGVGLYGSVEQWLGAYEKANAPAKKEAKVRSNSTGGAPSKKPKLSFKEQQELDGIEAAIQIAEAKVVECSALVEKSSTRGHVVLKEACRELEIAEKKVAKLYARWAELDAKKAS